MVEKESTAWLSDRLITDINKYNKKMFPFSWYYSVSVEKYWKNSQQ